MYSTCIFCTGPLGENVVLEAFPIGRRLAFDPARGRLWVVCRRCERWNLSPIEERWEAIEGAERLFRATRTRVSTENVGLARIAGGLDLVRIGSPMRPEFAAWRYGDQFGRRRRRALIISGGAAVAVSTFAISGIATGLISTGLLAQSGNLINLWVNGRTRLRLATADGSVVKLKQLDLQASVLGRGAGDEWHLSVGRKAQHVFTGAEAARVTGLIVPRLNASGARVRQVQEAVRELERGRGPECYLSNFGRWQPYRGVGWRPEGPSLGSLGKTTRLALEMALHEDQERLALDGELRGLELAWRSAEEIAAIADDLLVPDSVRSRMNPVETHGAATPAPTPPIP